ncbi:MAG: hypothetical protein ACKOBG_00350 [Actinomycetota bacterium]
MDAAGGGRRHVVGAVIARPHLWMTAVRQAFRAIPRDWWRVPPRLPRPDPAFVRFRIETASGPDGAPTPDEIVRYLEWCRGTDRARRRGGRG